MISVKKDSITLLNEANERESSGDTLGAISLCELALDGSELPDHYFTLARNCYSEASVNGAETLAWKALFAAIDGIECRMKIKGEVDGEFAIGIVRWVLEHFSDWYRLDISGVRAQSRVMDIKNGFQKGTSIRAMFNDVESKLEIDSSLLTINKLFKQSPLIIRPGRSRSGVDRELSYTFASIFSSVEDANAGEYINGLGLPVPGDYENQTYNNYLLTASKVEMQRIKARGRGVPSIMLTCLPKSASEFLCSTLSDILGAPIVRGTVGAPSHGVLVKDWMLEITQGGCVPHDHFSAREENLSVLRNCGINDIFVLVRDPRAAAFSLINMKKDWGLLESWEAMYPDLKSGFERFEEEVRSLSKWIELWINTKERGVNVKFITFSELTSQPETVLANILNLSSAAQFIPNISKVLTKRAQPSNFRRGDDAAWRDGLSQIDVDKIWAALPLSVRNLLNLKK
jgi:hypothetical protein